MAWLIIVLHEDNKTKKGKTSHATYLGIWLFNPKSIDKPVCAWRHPSPLTPPTSVFQRHLLSLISNVFFLYKIPQSYPFIPLLTPISSLLTSLSISIHLPLLCPPCMCVCVHAHVFVRACMWGLSRGGRAISLLVGSAAH